ncbi:MAG: protein jag [Firmicutes bacterium]|nr:protein jag [Bacillota bacterium]
MKSIEVSARTIEEAVNEGLNKLNCSISDCKVDILQEGAKGLFGVFGSKPATVRMTLLSNRDDEEEDNLGIDLQGALRTEMPSPKEKRAAPAEKKALPEKKPQEKSRGHAAMGSNGADRPKSNDVMERFKNAPLPGQAAAAAGKPRAKTAPRQRLPREEYREEAYAEAQEYQPVPAPEHIDIHDPSTSQGRAQQFLLEVTRRMGVDVQVEAKQNEEGHLYVSMYGDTLGILIGRRGETLDALQYLTSLQVNRGQENYIRVTLDTENYRAKREDALVRLASRMAGRAVKTGRKVSLEPMNPYERRILHSSLQENPDVTTHSEGDEPYRHVVVVPKK